MLHFFIDERNFSIFEQVSFILSILLYLFYPFPTKVPYGLISDIIKKDNHKKKGLAKILAITLNNRLGIFLMHFPALFIFVYAQIYYPNGDIISIPSICFIIMYVYRCFIYPFFRNVHSTPINLKAIIIMGLISFINGFVLARSLIFIPPDNQIGCIILSFILLLIFVLLVIHDFLICRIRIDSHDKYIKPINSLFFNSLTCPQYFFQLLFWIVFVLFLSDGKAIISFIPNFCLTYSNVNWF